ncbi:MAG: hypothetical protein WDA65_06815 [Christensenellales bacterium]
MDIKRRIDKAAGKIIALFEKRMTLVKKEAAGTDKFDLKEERQRLSFDAADKTVRYACDVQTIAYTEELVKLLLRCAVRYKKKLIKQKSGGKTRGL